VDVVMNKTLKALLAIAVILVALFALTGCGDKLVATKTTEEEGLTGETMKYEEKLEVKFKKDKVDSVKMTYKFEKEEQAAAMKSMFDLMTAMGGEEMKFEVKQSGKKLTIDLDAKAYAEMLGEEADINKEDLKKMLEEDGYKVK